MSSYLLGFAIGDFSVIHLEGKSPVPMALYAQRGKAGLGNDMLVEWWL
jgi:aminopeptidase N